MIRRSFALVLQCRPCLNGSILSSGLPIVLKLNRAQLTYAVLFARATRDRIFRFISPYSSECRNENRRNHLTVPNALTLMRIMSAPVTSYYILSGRMLEALCLLVFAGLTDFFDGYIARKFASQKSWLGSVIDPLGDKLLVSAVIISMSYVNLFPIELTALFITRDICIIIGACSLLYLSIPAPRHPRSLLKNDVKLLNMESCFVSKVNTCFQLASIAFAMTSEVFGIPTSLYLKTIW